MTQAARANEYAPECHIVAHDDHSNTNPTFSHASINAHGDSLYHSCMDTPLYQYSVRVKSVTNPIWC